ncbi:MAG: hypothetical protein GF329_22675 [Candidatus Lokiarchaeota archaeon]|nr:hypothetical protein [Candidatus Lokiarchaeota archaeon]
MFKGWIDLQVNGYKGIDFSNPNITLKEIIKLNKMFLKIGILGYCPTIISSPIEVYEHNLPLIYEASKYNNGAKILGIHLEGPFINSKEGPRGVHPRKYIIPPSIDLFERYQDLSNNSIVIITLAPECAGAFELIEHIIDTGNTIVSIGHSVATREIINGAVNLGVKAATHVGNGLSSTINRHNNPLWPILANDNLSAFFICDGFHLPIDLIKVGLRSKRISKFIVTSDMVHLSGLSPGSYDFKGTRVVLESNGKLHVEKSKKLAGSSLNIMECMNFMASMDVLNEEELRMIGFTNALKLLNKKIDKNTYQNAPKIRYENNKFSIYDA